MALNEEDQIQAVFISSRPVEVDPVSGNDVPPGSLPEEVRDDIPAQLSEGEYVVPADVLRFYGMKFFEDLRENAKIELARMDAEGRIGGEPVPAGGPQAEGDLTAEEIAALEEVTGAAVGGFITGQPTQSSMPDPYQQQQMMYRQGAPVAVGNAGYQEGGQVVDYTQPQFAIDDSSQFAPGFLLDQSMGTAPTEYTTVTLYGPAGDMITLTLPTQQDLYDQKIAEGYTTEQVAVTTQTAVGEDDTDRTPRPVTPEFNINEIPVEDLEKTAKGMSTMTNIATALASSAGLPVAAFINTSAVAKYNDILDRYAQEDPTGFAESGLEKKGSIFGGESSLYDNLADTDGVSGASFGDTWLGDLLGFDGEAGVQGPGLRDSFGGARRTGGDDDDGSPAVTPSNDSNNNEPESTPEVDTTITDTSSAAGVAEASGMTGGAALDEKFGISGLNKGGMMQKPKKKKKK